MKNRVNMCGRPSRRDQLFKEIIAILGATDGSREDRTRIAGKIAAAAQIPFRFRFTPAADDRATICPKTDRSLLP